ncbi:vWA domain-containing protein [Jeotgalibacillus haloalkalitolerans]|uniref:VWA domain-containing protein n=1 Tax=Jeotgalibacillus haloalkalitolerans TaxID=3104292 RepID=A0ABU5KR23_9BACL|nr:VWA domain-containing protein [Jeotgalibacillus sp. HH7-29]MDZ5713688.1 VWA domain-containing protein [Jeotgalibacillus sp. HH7-29]
MKKPILLSVFLLSFGLAACQEEEQSPAEPEQTAEAVDKMEKPADQAEEEASVKQTGQPEGDLVEAVEALNVRGAAETAQDLVDQKVGIFGEEQFQRSNKEHQEMLMEALEEIPPLPEEPTQKEYDAYFDYLYDLNARAFPDPNDTIAKMEFALSGMPEASGNYTFKENYNVEIILDASGSMGAESGGSTRMEQAKSEIQDFLSSLPEEANVSLRVYGHEGTGDEADKAMSCGAIEEVYERGTYDEDAFQSALDQFEPAGWTPVAGALESAMESFKDLDGEENTNLIYLVSDGIETCDGDPAAVAKTFADSNISPIINVIGFNADSETQDQLRQVAREADGVFTNVQGADELRKEFDQTEEILKRWERWKRQADLDVQSASNKSYFAMLAFSNENFKVGLSQHVSMIHTLDYLRHEEEVLSMDQDSELNRRNQETDERIKDVTSEVEEEIEVLRDAGLAEMEQLVEELYPDDLE